MIDQVKRMASRPVRQSLSVAAVCLCVLSSWGCQHEAREHARIRERTIGDGEIIILEGSGKSALLLLQNQQVDPEVTDFVIYTQYAGQFNISTSWVHKLKQMSVDAPPHYSIGWSAAREGFGYLYYEDSKPAGLRMYRTGTKNLEEVKADYGKVRYPEYAP